MSPLAWSAAVAEIPDGGLPLARRATPEDCRELAVALAVLEVTRVELKGRLLSRGGGRYRLTGKLFADVTQACVVTLDPVPAALDLALEIDLVPMEQMPRVPDGDGDPDDTDTVEAPLIEPIRNGSIDLGDIVYQEIAAALDPYPRSPDAALDLTQAAPAADDRIHPFAKLKALQPKPK